LQKRSQEFQATRDSVAKQINEAAQPILAALMRERGANLVLPQAATLQSSGALNITADAISRLDRALPRVSTATPAK
jgi:Skp family chaperone for outer membrane proteins